MNQLHQVLLISRKGFAVITTTVMMSLLGVEVTKAEPQPSCFMINPAGEVVNLADICNVKPQRQLNSSTPTPTNNALNTAFIPNRTAIPNRPIERVYFVGNGNIPFTLGTSSTTYYSGDRSTYVRRYSETRRFANRDDARNTLLRIGSDTTNTTFSDRVPFIIYRYQK